MSKYYVVSDNNIIIKKLIIINGDNICRIIYEEVIEYLTIYNIHTFKQFIKNLDDVDIIIEYLGILYKIPSFIIEMIKFNAYYGNTLNLSITSLNNCYSSIFMNNVIHNIINIYNFNTIFKIEETDYLILNRIKYPMSRINK